MLYRYEVTKGRKRIKGITEAQSCQELEEKIKRLYGSSARVKIGTKRFWFSSHKVKASVKMLFYRQMEAMLKCGIPLPDGLRLAASSCPDSNFSLRILDIEAEILQGKYMHQALQNLEYFNTVEKALIAAGEESASLDIIFKRLYLYFKSIFRIRSQVKESVLYPLSVLAVLLCVLVLVSHMVIPKFIEIYQSLGIELPLITLLVLEIVGKVTTVAPFALVGIVMLIILIKQVLKNKKYKYKWDSFLLTMPHIGEILLASYWSQILRALEVLIAAGVDLFKSLQHAQEVASRIPIRETLEHASRAVLSGRMMYSSFQKNLEYVPPIAIGMIAAGENTGSLESMIATAAEYLEDELKHRIEMFMKLLEPLLIVVVGVVVGFVVLALYLPIFTLASKM